MTNDGVPDKESIRERGLDRRRALADAKRRRASRRVAERLESWSVTAEAERVAGYVAFDDEIDPRGFLEWRLDTGRDVLLPRVLNDTEMVFAEVDDLDLLEPGTFGIPEPTNEAAAIETVDVFLVPGAAFDRGGRRIGLGAGYYDRALGRRLDAAQRRDEVRFVGTAYDAQIWEEPLPTEPHDVRMDAVVTETEVHAVSEGLSPDSNRRGDR